MKQLLKAMSVVLILAGGLMAQQEVSPDVYPDKSPAAEHVAVAKKQPAQHKAVAAKKAAAKTTLVAAHRVVKAPRTRSN